MLKIDKEVANEQIRKLNKLKEERDNEKVQEKLYESDANLGYIFKYQPYNLIYKNNFYSIQELMVFKKCKREV
ncbi:MAG: hypothetical protein ACFE75_02815 [Candidatus Hodarchaeota archaeon]